MFLLYFVNIGCVTLLVNMHFFDSVKIPLLNGDYEEFSVMWYRLIGSVLLIQISLMIFTTNGANFAIQLLQSCKRCKDRSCRCRANSTKQLSQQDYEELNFGSLPFMEYKYSNLLTVLFVTMMYSSGMPILYFISTVFFLATYWTEKVMFFYFYRKPENLDENLAKRTLGWFKYALFAHMVMGLLMYSNVKILPGKAE